MSSLAQHDSSTANQEQRDSAASQQTNYTGLNGSAVNSDIRTEERESRLANLIEEHDDLDQAIASMLSVPACNDRVINRLKKRKLHIKDEIFTLQFICGA